MCSFHMMKYYSPVKKNEVLVSATVWMKYVYNEHQANYGKNTFYVSPSADGHLHHFCICFYLETAEILRNKHGHGQWTSSKLGKEYIKVVCCHPAYLTYMQSISYEMLGWMKHKLESRLLGEMSVTSDMQMHHPYGRK